MPDTRTLWLYRPLLNWQDLYRWAGDLGIKKMLPPDELHLTLATCRQPVDVEGLVLQTSNLVIPAGHKQVQIFGYTAKALAFGHPEIKARHEELAEIFPSMDHAAMLRPHVTLMRGGKMPKGVYEGELVFGPEVAGVFDERAIRTIKHSRVEDVLEDLALTSSPK